VTRHQAIIIIILILLLLIIIIITTTTTLLTIIAIIIIMVASIRIHSIPASPPGKVGRDGAKALIGRDRLPPQAVKQPRRRGVKQGLTPLARADVQEVHARAVRCVDRRVPAGNVITISSIIVIIIISSSSSIVIIILITIIHDWSRDWLHWPERMSKRLMPDPSDASIELSYLPRRRLERKELTSATRSVCSYTPGCVRKILAICGPVVRGSYCPSPLIMARLLNVRRSHLVCRISGHVTLVISIMITITILTIIITTGPW
jgi:hypothetical protein